MPMKSKAQRAFLWARHPEVAREFESKTPPGKKLPEHVKKSSAIGASDALARFGLKIAGEELRLKIPERTFHGRDAAFKSEAARGHKQADHDSEGLEAMLQEIDTPAAPGHVEQHKDPLDRATIWGPPTNPAAGDAGGRMSDLGVPQSIGTV